MRRTGSLLLLGWVVASNLSAAEAKHSLQGTKALVTLLSPVSSKSPDGSRFAARLEKPVALDGQVIAPQGTIFEGQVRTFHARRLNRAGSLRLLFQTVRLPDGTARAVDLSFVSVHDKSLKSDSEGTIRSRVSKKRLLFQTGLAVLAGKITDDVSESVIASVTAGTARYIGLGTGLAFFLWQKGREVKLPAGTEVEVVFNRAFQTSRLTARPPRPVGPTAGGFFSASKRRKMATFSSGL